MTTPQTPGRLAFREEGAHWNAYFAAPDTMVGAIWLGGIAMRFIENNKVRKSVFMAMMRDAVGDILLEITGERPEWPEPEGRPAPEHERTKE